MEKVEDVKSQSHVDEEKIVQEDYFDEKKLEFFNK